MEEDGPHLGFKRLVVVLGIVFIFSISIVAAAQTPSIDVKKPKVVKKHKLISGWFKPSVGHSGYKYKRYHKTWINYCPGCHRYGTLRKNPKHVPESELTCKCDRDYCGVTGLIKNGKKNKRLIKG